MKSVRAIIKTVLIFAVFMVALLAVSVYLILPKSINPEKYAAYVNKNLSKLTETAEAALTDESSLSIAQRTLLGKGKIDHVWPKEDRVIFSLDNDYAPMEGEIRLIYFPDGEYEFSYGNYPLQPVNTDDESVLRWEGDSVWKGWVNVTRMSDCFFLEEANLPT